MKKYLFGLGAMVVGAGLMFVLMHGEVEAQRGPEKCICSAPTLGTIIPTSISYQKGERESLKMGIMMHCQCGKLECVTFFRGGTAGPPQLSCHKSGGIFK